MKPRQRGATFGRRYWARQQAVAFRDDRMTYSWHYDRAGRRITLGRWVRLLERGKRYRRVAATVVNGQFVSTVWLGLDHGWGGRRQIFETMIFPVGSFQDLGCWRYATERDARKGHGRAVAEAATTRLEYDE